MPLMTPTPDTRSGIINCQQLRTAALSSNTANGALDNAGGTNSQSQPQDRSKMKPNDTIFLIYSALVSAVAMTFVHVMTRKNGWLAFGGSFCLRVSDEEGDPMSRLAVSGNPEHGECQRSVDQIDLDVRWSPSGILTVSGQCSRIAGLSTLEGPLSELRQASKHGMTYGDSVFIAPLAVPCKFIKFDHPSSARSNGDRQERATTIAWLAARGVRIAKDGPWVHLESNSERKQDGKAADIFGIGSFLWPCELCFFQAPASHARGPEVFQRITSGTFVDPLLKAEQWFLGHGARKEAAEAHRKAEEERKLAESQLPKNVPEEQGDDNIVINRMAQTNQYMSAQEASGIYPTPPDGLASSMPGVLDNHSSPMDIDETEEGDNFRAGSPATSLGRRNSERQGADDLFGDMDADIFGANDLTEADFNFFDDLDDPAGEVELSAEATEEARQALDREVELAACEALQGVLPLGADQEDALEETDADVKRAYSGNRPDYLLTRCKILCLKR